MKLLDVIASEYDGSCSEESFVLVVSFSIYEGGADSFVISFSVYEGGAVGAVVADVELISICVFVLYFLKYINTLLIITIINVIVKIITMGIVKQTSLSELGKRQARHGLDDLGKGVIYAAPQSLPQSSSP